MFPFPFHLLLSFLSWYLLLLFICLSFYLNLFKIKVFFYALHLNFSVGQWSSKYSQYFLSSYNVPRMWSSMVLFLNCASQCPRSFQGIISEPTWEWVVRVEWKGKRVAKWMESEPPTLLNQNRPIFLCFMHWSFVLDIFLKKGIHY